MLGEGKGSATVSVAPVGVSPTETNGCIVLPSVNPFRTKLRYWAPARAIAGDALLERCVFGIAVALSEVSGGPQRYLGGQAKGFGANGDQHRFAQESLPGGVRQLFLRLFERECHRAGPIPHPR